jgi:hypothetical protein
MPDLMEGPARTRLVAIVLLLAVAAPLAIVAVAGDGGGEGEEETELRVERAPDLPEMILYMSPDASTPERSGGRESVTVECLDGGGRVLARRAKAWPFTDTDGNTVDPHVHLPVNPARINDVERCRVRPADPPLEAPVL